MPVVKTASGEYYRYAILVPTKSRVKEIAAWHVKMPHMLTADTFLGVEVDQLQMYRNSSVPINIVSYENPTGSVAFCRERLRRAALRGSAQGKQYDFFVVTDDNAKFSRDAMDNLVTAAAAWPKHRNPTVWAGMHNTAAHFDRGVIAKYAHGRSYPQIAMIFQCYPRALYEAYSYPTDAYGLDDRHFVLWAISQGLTREQFRVCMDAPFTKSRYQAGGQGPIDQRILKNGKAIARLATDFPNLVGMTGTLRLPWQFMFKHLAGESADRLPGGSMRKEGALFSGKKTVRVKVRKTL